MLAFGSFGWQELLILGLLALLFFGRRLPEVAKNLGKGIVEFKKGLKGIEDDMNTAGDQHNKPAPPNQLTSSSNAATTPGTTGTHAEKSTSNPNSNTGT